eukprot:208265-Rhodomonas_salina.1
MHDHEESAGNQHGCQRHDREDGEAHRYPLSGDERGHCPVVQQGEEPPLLKNYSTKSQYLRICRFVRAVSTGAASSIPGFPGYGCACPCEHTVLSPLRSPKVAKLPAASTVSCVHTRVGIPTWVPGYIPGWSTTWYSPGTGVPPATTRAPGWYSTLGTRVPNTGYPGYKIGSPTYPGTRIWTHHSESQTVWCIVD